VPDFSRPGQDGALPSGTPEWREGLGELTPRGLIYTARAARNLLPCDQKCRIAASFKQKVPQDGPVDYAKLYGRVKSVTAARAAEMSCQHGTPLHSRIIGRLWSSIPGVTFNFPVATLITEMSCPKGAIDEGEPEPGPGAFATPGGTPAEEFARICSQPADEIFNEYDLGGPPEGSEPITFSYGEHVEASSSVDYAPFVERAENRARFHHRLLSGVSCGTQRPFAIFRRNWFAASDNLIVVVIYFQA
jgi:hypothetical protein